MQLWGTIRPAAATQCTEGWKGPKLSPELTSPGLPEALSDWGSVSDPKFLFLLGTPRDPQIITLLDTRREAGQDLLLPLFCCLV